MYEWVGYIASGLVAISITIKGGLYFRILNLAGSVCFLIYGIIIGSWPVKIINVYGIGINIFHLTKIILNRKKITENTAQQ